MVINSSKIFIDATKMVISVSTIDIIAAWIWCIAAKRVIIAAKMVIFVSRIAIIALKAVIFAAKIDIFAARTGIFAARMPRMARCKPSHSRNWPWSTTSATAFARREPAFAQAVAEFPIVPSGFREEPITPCTAWNSMHPGRFIVDGRWPVALVCEERGTPVRPESLPERLTSRMP